MYSRNVVHSNAALGSPGSGAQSTLQATKKYGGHVMAYTTLSLGNVSQAFISTHMGQFPQDGNFGHFRGIV